MWVKLIPNENNLGEDYKRWDYLWYDRQVYLKESWKTDSQGPNQGKADVRCCPVCASLLTVITIALFFSGREEKNEKKNISKTFQYFHHNHHHRQSLTPFSSTISI